MPRVNRDLQRRMAARKERERRRPSGERRYQFDSPERALEAEETNGEVAETVETPAARARTRATERPASASASARASVRVTHKSFSDYREEYAYVYSDLRRVGAVVGGLLVVLIVLYFVLPLLVH